MAIRKVPIPYERKNKRNADGSVGKTVEPLVAVSQVKAVKKKSLKIDRHLKLTDTDTNADIQIRLVSRIPTQGQLIIYDQMTKAGMSPSRTIRGLWKRDFSLLETQLEEGAVNDLDQMQFEKLSIETTRLVSTQFYNKAAKRFDPFGLLSKRALGQKIGEAVINLIRKEEVNDI